MAVIRTPEHLQDLLPHEAFASLANRQGAVFLDSAGEGGRYSLLASDPETILTGNLDDVSELRCWLEENSAINSPDLGFPVGGAIGAIDYSGEFAFGLYRKVLVHDHASQTWTDIGGLADAIGDCPSERAGFSPDFHAQMERTSFLRRVRAAQEYIAAGDIYQVNLAHRFRSEWPVDESPWSFYRMLREVSPTPYAAYLNLNGRQILSSSPEQFLHMSGRGVQTRPIKGTRPRFRDPEADERSAYELLRSEKENAELIMITDLERNDLGQVCEFGSVKATELLKLERYEQVFHLVSTVEGQLRPGIDHLDVLRACSPGGSITGAPKRRAMEIIDELEEVPRGLYTGAIGYLGLNGESQFNIAIRTMVVENHEAHFHVGAGIVADSNPEAEWEETLHKARGILLAAGR